MRPKSTVPAGEHGEDDQRFDSADPGRLEGPAPCRVPVLIAELLPAILRSCCFDGYIRPYGSARKSG